MNTDAQTKHKIIYDPLYGFIHLTSLEWEIIHTPFYQRLKWIKQLGFSFYTFPGAEHSRFGHSIGVMHNAHCILTSLKKSVPDEELFDSRFTSKEKSFHQNVRLGALLHDLGTFPFSHTTESSYIRFGDTTNAAGGKKHPDDHEHLGSFIIKNTDYEGGITRILKKYNVDPQKISDLVKGIDENVLANQVLHAELDCDRMDYLLRDAHYSGMKYGTYDRDYLLHHFKVASVSGQEIVTINDNALHAVEDFLMARFAWYSQVVRSARGARFDAIADALCFYFLEKGMVSTYSQLMDYVANSPEKFYAFNDHYFMNVVHHYYTTGAMDKDPMYKDLARRLLYGIAPRTIRLDEFKQRILSQDDDVAYKKIVKRTEEKVEEIKSVLKKKGGKLDWVLPDLPKKNIIFVKSLKSVVKSKMTENLLLERDPVKIQNDSGDVKLLGDMENSIIAKLQNQFNFVPNIFCSESAYQLLIKEGIIGE